MKKFFMLSGANIRKGKSQTAVLMLLFVVASLILNIGLMLSMNFTKAIDELKEELNSSDFCSLITDSLYTDTFKNFIKDNDKILSYEEIPMICAFDVKLNWDGDERSVGIAFFNGDQPRTITQRKTIGKTKEPSDSAMPAYIPYHFKSTGGYELGDIITIDINKEIRGGDYQPYEFEIIGFIEDVLFSSLDMGVPSCYLNNEDYKKIESDISNFKSTLFVAKIDESESHNMKDFQTEYSDTIAAIYKEEKTEDNPSVLAFDFSMDYEMLKQVRTMMAVAVAAIMVVFSVVLAVVCIAVISTRISNSIEEDIPKIGSLKSIGYTSRQISFSIILQYCSVAFIGILIGTPLSYLALPSVGNIFVVQTGLLWKPSIDITINLISLFVLIIAVILAAVLGAVKVRKIKPAEAIRGSAGVHKFKRNYFPLEKTFLSVVDALSLKSVVQNIRQTVTIFIVMLFISYTAGCAITVFYNAAIDTGEFKKVPGMEVNNVDLIFAINDENDAEKYLSQIRSREEVRKAFFYDTRSSKAEGNAASIYVNADYSKVETNTVYKGRYPETANECCISGSIANAYNKEVGDIIVVGEDEGKREFKVTGLTQGIGGSGGLDKVYLTTDGIKRVKENFVPQQMCIYLDKESTNIDAPTFIKNIKSQYGDELYEGYDTDTLFEEGVSAYTSIMAAVGQAIVIVAAVVIILVLYFIINSLIVRKRRELGIQKAIGYTTNELCHQTAASLMFPIFLGAVAGVILNGFTNNILMTTGMGGLGVMKANFITPWLWLGGTSLTITIISLITILLITLKIRKISAYTLVTE